MAGIPPIDFLKGTSKKDATDVKLGRSRGSRGSRVGLASGFSVFSGAPAGLFPSRCGLQADVSPDDHHVGAAATGARSRGRGWIPRTENQRVPHPYNGAMDPRACAKRHKPSQIDLNRR